MNHKNLIFILIIAVGFLACNKNSNTYLGQLPDMSSQFKQQVLSIEQAMSLADDQEKEGLQHQLDELRKSFEAQSNQYLQKRPLAPVPFVQKADYPFEIREVKVIAADCSGLACEIKAFVNEDIKDKSGKYVDYIKIYGRCYDVHGQEISQVESFQNAAESKGPFVKGDEIIFYGHLSCCDELQSFNRLIFVPFGN